MAKSEQKETLKEFTCTNCGTTHIINSKLDVKHSFYEEDPEKASKVAESEGVQDPEKEDGEQDTGEEAGQTFEEKEQAEKEEDEDSEFEEDFEESDKEDDDYNWGGWE